MRKNSKIILGIIFTFCLFLSLSISAYADGVEVTYNNDGTFTVNTGNLFENFSNIMPGDEIEQIITIKNRCRRADLVHVHLQAEPHVEKEGVHKARASYNETMEFLKQLKLTVQLVDGAELSAATADLTAGLTEPQLVGRFYGKYNTSRVKVTLTVPEDMKNEFAGLEGEIDWVFTAAEFMDQIPMTGDDSNIALYSALMLLSAFSAGFVLYRMCRRKV